MHIDLTGHHIDVTPALRRYVDDKIGRLQRHYDQITHVHVILSVEKLRHKAEATFHLSGADVHADAVDADMYAAIDALADKIDRQIKKHKEKHTNHHRSEATHKNSVAE